VQPLVLVVEDDGVLRGLLTSVLRDEVGVRVVAAGDGEEAKAMAQENRPDLVLLDLMMPKLDGFGFCAWAKGVESLRGVPVIAVSALGPAEQLRQRALSAGCTDVILKPFDLEEFVAVVTRWLPPAARRQAEPGSAAP
jgi:DNA-binding response OmpR family regulator